MTRWLPSLCGLALLIGSAFAENAFAQGPPGLGYVAAEVSAPAYPTRATWVSQAAPRRRTVVTGAIIGATAGLLIGVIGYSACRDPDMNGDQSACFGKAALIVGGSAGLGAFIGWFLGD